jgi:hypothetical protein
LHRIVDRNVITIKAPRATIKDQQVPLEIPLAFDKHVKKKALSEWSMIGALRTIELPTNEQQTGCQGLLTKMTK